VNQPRGTQCYHRTQREDEDPFTLSITDLAAQYGRYGYRRITAMLRRDGWQVGKTGSSASGVGSSKRQDS
jgi:hypothetical protein